MALVAIPGLNGLATRIDSEFTRVGSGLRYLAPVRSIDRVI
jgi:hypothetical protein